MTARPASERELVLPRLKRHLVGALELGLFEQGLVQLGHVSPSVQKGHEGWQDQPSMSAGLAHRR